MRALNRRKRGFTLIETVVTVGIVAAMAAVVYPQVVKQFDAADPTRVQNDLKNIQTAVESFSVNMSGTLPGDLDDLANPLTTGSALPLADSTFASSGAMAPFTTSSGWNGPYLDVSLVESGTTELTRPTGYGAIIYDDFVCFNATDNLDASNGTAANQECPTPGGGERLFLAVRITGLGTDTDDKFIAINDLFDGASEGANRKSLGRIRYINVGSSTPTAFFLLAPLN